MADDLVTQGVQTWQHMYRVKDGRPIHDGDCHFWSWSICTCGLLHWLAPTLPTATWYAKERAQHERALYQGTHA